MDFPTSKTAAFEKDVARLLDARRAGASLETLARDVLAVLGELATRHGLDALADRLADADQGEAQVAAVADKLATIDLDGGGPRAQKPKQVVDAALAALGLALVEDGPDRALALPHTVRVAVEKAIDAAVAPFQPGRLRDAIIAGARARLDESHHAAFAKIAKDLDDRGVKLLKQTKVPLDAMQAAQRAIGQAKDAIAERATRAAFDGAAAAIAAEVGAEAAARLDQPVTLRSTPRDVAIARACDARVDLTPTGVAHVLFSALTELVPIAWGEPETIAVPYAASKKFAVGDVIEHPKFGRGAVVASLPQRIEVEFPDGTHTLVHARG